MNLEQLLEDLYKLDPSLRTQEAELKEIIEKMISRRPDAEPDEEFKKRLKAELIARMEQRKKRAGFFVIHRKAVVAMAGIAAAVIVVLTFAVRPGLISSIMSPDMMKSSEQAFDYKQESGKSVTDKVETSEPVIVGNLAAGKDSKAEPVEERKEARAKNEPFTETPAQAPERSIQKMSLEYDMPVEAELMMNEADESEAWFGAEDINVAELKTEESGSGEEYKSIVENAFITAADEPLSTFSIDVDTASYANVRRFINSGMLPYPDAVRIEELINYFSYDYEQPETGLPFSFTTELSQCPWDSTHQLLHVGLQGYEVPLAELPPTNIVFLIDSSGSMQDENKLPLLKDSMSLLIDTLRPEDRVSIVAYAGSAGLVLSPTAGNNKRKIFRALDDIEAGGSTAGGAGIDLAYKTASENLFKDGNNRVIIATDGDFNVGQSSEDELKTMIEERRNQGIYLTVLGLGMGNYKDARMEALADNGNGNYAYIDTLNEANKVLVTELSSTLLTIAKDVKIQIDFNSKLVESYRLIGYENRVMAAEDFDNDKKDAGEIGAGHSVTALYEIIPSDGAAADQALAQIKFRYKKPDEEQSLLIKSEVPNVFVPFERTSDNFRFSTAVAEWGLILKNSQYLAGSDINEVTKQALAALGQDSFGYRAEFVKLLYKTEDLLQ